jgi:DNA-binding CsgD family transcriptional regulator
VLLRESVRLAWELDHKPFFQYSVIGLGGVAASLGWPVRAARLWGAAEGMSEAYGTHLLNAGRSLIEYALEQQTGSEPAAQVPHPAGLTAREAEVLRLVATGLTSAQVAEKLFLSSRTVEWYLGSIYRKLGFNSRTEAARFAVEHGLL